MKYYFIFFIALSLISISIWLLIYQNYGRVRGAFCLGQYAEKH